MATYKMILSHGRNWIAYDGWDQREDGWYLGNIKHGDLWIWAPGSRWRVVVCWLLGWHENNPLYIYAGSIRRRLRRRKSG